MCPLAMSDPDFSTLSHVSPALTNDKLDKGLTDWFNEETKFTHWEYVSETGKGDSYLSECIRIRIFGKTREGNTKHIQVILKNIPKSIARQLTFRSADFFRNEINFYEQVLPELLKFQSEKNPNEPFDNYAKIFLAYCDGTDDFICLEDASLESFGSAVRQEGLDLEHCKLTFKTLAKFHALSFAMKDQQPEKFEELTGKLVETYYAPHFWSWYERFWKRVCGIAVNAVETEYPNTVYVDKIKEFAVPERYKQMIRAVETRENGVISHGDSWTNNFLYKYVKNSVIDVKVIDFQLSRYASPVLDTSFVFCGCTTQELRDKHYDELLKYYYDVLSEQICELGSDASKIYSWETYLRDVEEFSFFGLAFSFESTPMIVLAPEDAVSMDMKGDEKVNIDDVWAIGNFKTKEGRLREANNIVHWVNYGYI